MALVVRGTVDLDTGSREGKDGWSLVIGRPNLKPLVEHSGDLDHLVATLLAAYPPERAATVRPAFAHGAGPPTARPAQRGGLELALGRQHARRVGGSGGRGACSPERPPDHLGPMLLGARAGVRARHPMSGSPIQIWQNSLGFWCIGYSGRQLRDEEA